jgi:hypothetical protein
MHPSRTICCLLAGLLLAACASTDASGQRSWRLPWHKQLVPPAQAVTELTVQGESAASVQQFWNRNTLRIDLGQVTGAGGLTMKPSATNGWPVRLEFAVRPGSMTQLEIRGEQRAVINVSVSPAGAGEALIYPLALDVYTRTTPQIELRWQ